MLIGIDALGNQGTGFITTGTGFFKPNLGITTEGHALLLARPIVAEEPDFSASGRHIECETITVAEGVVITGDSGVPNCHF